MRTRPRKTKFKPMGYTIISDVVQYEEGKPDLCIIRLSDGDHRVSAIYADVKLSPQELRWLAGELDRLNKGE